jgi:hypothetical protein
MLLLGMAFTLTTLLEPGLATITHMSAPHWIVNVGK